MTDVPQPQNLIAYIQSNRALICGWVTVVGCAVVLITHALGVVIVPEHDFVADTISDLAAGRYGWIQDAGLILYGLSLIVAAIGLKAWDLGGDDLWWNLGITLLILIGLDVLLIGAYNEYGNREPGGLVIHIYLVYFLGFGFAAMVWLIGRGLRQIRSWLGMGSIALAIGWLVLAPPFLMLSTEWDGLYERFLAVILVGWTAGIGWLLIQHGRGKLVEDEK